MNIREHVQFYERALREVEEIGGKLVPCFSGLGRFLCCYRWVDDPPMGYALSFYLLSLSF